MAELLSFKLQIKTRFFKTYARILHYTTVMSLKCHKFEIGFKQSLVLLSKTHIMTFSVRYINRP